MQVGVTWPLVLCPAHARSMQEEPLKIYPSDGLLLDLGSVDGAILTLLDVAQRPVLTASADRGAWTDSSTEEAKQIFYGHEGAVIRSFLTRWMEILLPAMRQTRSGTVSPQRASRHCPSMTAA